MDDMVLIINKFDLSNVVGIIIHLQQAMFVKEHFFDGTHRFDDPVSNTTLNICGGLPRAMGP